MALGPLMIDLAGTELGAEERERLQHPLVGGVILFSRNYESPEQIQTLVQAIHALRSPPLLVAVDHEGGRVQRFRSGFVALPPARRLGELYDRNPQQALRSAESQGWLMAAELRAVGVDFSFAPVLDLDRGISGVIGDRAFHSDPEVVAELGAASIRGMHRAGMAGVGKHFPGHGAVTADSHASLPVDERDFAQIAAADLVPFARLIRQGLSAVMPAHVVYPSVDPEPAGFSRFWLKQVLREQMGFSGVIFSDDLSMEGAKGAGDLAARAQKALAAGCDMALVCNDPAGAARLLDGMGSHIDPALTKRLAHLHGREAPDRSRLIVDRHYRDAVQLALGLA